MISVHLLIVYHLNSIMQNPSQTHNQPSQPRSRSFPESSDTFLCKDSISTMSRVSILSSGHGGLHSSFNNALGGQGRVLFNKGKVRKRYQEESVDGVDEVKQGNAYSRGMVESTITKKKRKRRKQQHRREPGFSIPQFSIVICIWLQSKSFQLTNSDNSSDSPQPKRNRNR